VRLSKPYLSTLTVIPSRSNGGELAPKTSLVSESRSVPSGEPEDPHTHHDEADAQRRRNPAVGEGTALPNGYQNDPSPRRCHNGMV
jgi:hypothetical protein